MNWHAAAIPGLLHAYAAPLLAFAAALLGGLICRDKGRQKWQRAAAAAALLAGWAALQPAVGVLRAFLAPRSLLEYLLLPALAGLLLAIAAEWRPGRLQRWGGAGLALLSGWWLAGSPPGLPEFWRVWLAVGLGAWALTRAIAGQPQRGVAAALALWAGLVMTGAPATWIAAALVAVAVSTGLSPWGGVAPPVLLATVAAAADLAAGRLIRGGTGPVDWVVASVLGAPLLVPWLGPRMGKRLGAAAPAAACVAAAGMAVAAGWIASKITLR